MTALLAGLALASQVAYLDALFWSSLGTMPLGHGSAQPALLSSAVSGAFLALFAGILSVLMAFRTRGERGAYALAVSLAAWSYILSYSGLMVLFGPVQGSAWRATFAAHFLVVEALGLAGLLRFTAEFPRPLAPGDLQGSELLPPWLRPVQRVRRWLLRPAAPWLAGAGACALAFGVNAALGRAVRDAAFLTFVDLLRLAVLALVVLNVRRAFLSGTRADRDLVLWLVLGFVLLMGAVGLLLGGNVLSAVTGWELPVLNWRPMVLNLGVLGLLWGAARGVSYRGSRRPTLLVRRVTILSVMVTLSLFLAAGLESLLAGPRGTQTGLPHGAGTLVALVAVGVLYLRTGRPLDGVLERAVADVAPPPMEG